jgi:hypothetical protein
MCLEFLPPLNKNREQVLATRIEFLPPFLRTKKNHEVIEHILRVSLGNTKRRFGNNYHEVLVYFLLFVMKNKKISFFLKRQKNVFTTPITRNTPSTNISTNIPNVRLPLAGEWEDVLDPVKISGLEIFIS